MSTPHPIDPIAVIDAAVATFVEIGESTPPETPVPSCPDWSLADLLFHGGGVVQFWTQMAQGVAPGEDLRPVRPGDDEVVTWFVATIDEWLPALTALDPSALSSFSLLDDRSVAFVLRRVAHELTIHAWDAADAAGVDPALKPAVAIDGIDEYLDVWLSSPYADRGGAVQTVHLHATDVSDLGESAGEWHITVGDDELSVTREHAKGDIAVRGSAVDLLLLLWGRRTADDVELYGPEVDLDRFLARVAA